MSAKPIEVKKVEKIEKVVEPVKSQAQIAEEMAHKKAILDGLDANKKKKDVQLKTVEELEAHIQKVRQEADNLVGEYNMKVRVNENLGNSIASAQSNLALFDAQFEAKNAKRLKELEKKVAEVEAADKEFQALILDNREKQKTLANEQTKFEMEREQNRQLVHAANTALDQNNAMWSAKEADLLKREEELKGEKAKFEDYKASLEPEANRITSIKNENGLLLQKVEMQNFEMERRRLSSVRERELADEARVASQTKLDQQKQNIANEDARLRKWEQELKDQALELRVQSEQVAKVLRREQLEKEIKANEVEKKASK